MEKNSIDRYLYYPPGGILIWIIVFIEIITFGMAIVAFQISKQNDPTVFKQGAEQLNTTIGTINTIVLLISGYFMASAVNAIKNQKINVCNRLISLTISGGAAFITFKSIEYYQKIENNLLPDENIFYTYYWFITLFHLIHVIIGIIILFIIKKNLKKIPTEEDRENLEASAVFWHMCDLIWLLIFPIIYLIK
jgi:nitric oxide reductase NorE protein